MAQSFSEWRRENPDGTRNQYYNYLGNLLRKAQQANAGDPVVARIVDKLYGDLEPERTYTREEVSAALGQAANLVQETHDGYENTDTVFEDTAVDLAVNAGLYLLDRPDATLDEIIPASYADVELNDSDFEDGELDDNGNPLPGRDRAALVRKVRGWLA